LGQDATWFHDGRQWHRGVLHAQSGQVVPGLAHVWLADQPIDGNG
jgi:hypothetical protein